MAESEISTDSEFNPNSESLADRIYALRDIVPPTTRAYFGGKITACHDVIARTLLFTGKTLWIVSSSALLLAVPFALATSEDQQLAAMEQEMKMRDMGGEMLTAGTGEAGGPRKDPTTAAQVSAMLGESGTEGKPAL